MRRLASFLIVLVACVGCHMCSDCCDYSAPVANSPYGYSGGRAGSNLSGGYVPGKISTPPTNEDAAAARKLETDDLTPMPLSPTPLTPTPPLVP